MSTTSSLSLYLTMKNSAVIFFFKADQIDLYKILTLNISGNLEPAGDVCFVRCVYVGFVLNTDKPLTGHISIEQHLLMKP